MLYKYSKFLIKCGNNKGLSVDICFPHIAPSNISFTALYKQEIAEKPIIVLSPSLNQVAFIALHGVTGATLPDS
jgi:hypothetical protein